MKQILLIAFIFLFTKVEAQNIVISFSSTKSDEKIDSVLVENLSQGKSIVLKGTTNLELTASTVTSVPIYGLASPFRVYPNPVSDVCFLQFENKESGNIVVGLYDLTGKQIISQTRFLQQGVHEFQLSGLPSGISVIKIIGAGFNYTDKIISTGKGLTGLNLKYSGESSSEQNPTQLKSATTNVLMQYQVGERLKYTLYANGNITIQTDVPTQSKTVASTFVEAKDADGKSYATVTIGTQTWMAENLAYLPTIDTLTKYSESKPYYYVSNYYGKSLSEAKSSKNYKMYGVLYNWPAAITACPVGWHLPSIIEFQTLSDYLKTNGYGNKESGNNGVAKSLASIYDWKTSWYNGAIGNDLSRNNSSGFNALPSGCFAIDGWGKPGFFSEGTQCDFWSSIDYALTHARACSLSYDWSYFSLDSPNPKKYGLSVRCVKD